MMSGESLEDYFRRLNLDEGRREFPESINEGKYEENEIEEHYLKDENRKEYSPSAPDWYST
jgi:primase-polymerase (primpol)-like protein